MPDPNMTSLPEWVTDTLREPTTSTVAARARIMDAVRVLPRPRRLSAPIGPSRWLRRGLLSPVGGLMTTVFLMAALTLRLGPMDGVFGRAGMAIETAAFVLGDSVVPTPNSHVSGAVVPPASRSRLLDTLRIVEFVIRGSSVHAVSVVGDFNAWKRGATPLVAVGDREWRARVLVRRDALQASLNVAYIINDATLIPAAAGIARRWGSSE